MLFYWGALQWLVIKIGWLLQVPADSKPLIVHLNPPIVPKILYNRGLKEKSHETDIFLLNTLKLNLYYLCFR